MSVPAECAACLKHKMCLRIGRHMVCILCLGTYNEVRTMVLEAGNEEGWKIPETVENGGRS